MVIEIISKIKAELMSKPTPIKGYLHDMSPNIPPRSGPMDSPSPIAASYKITALAVLVFDRVTIAVNAVQQKVRFLIPSHL